ncbi:MAG: DUF6132 family protein [Myxococcota bacterium]
MIQLVAASGLGAAAGYGWFRVVGCGTGTCPITARWWTAALYGAVVGALVAGGGA